MKRTTSVALLLLVAAGICYSQAWNEKDLMGREIYKVSLDAKSAKTVTEKLGTLYVACSFSGVSFRDAAGAYLNSYDLVYIFAVKGSVICVLGKIDKQGIADANGDLLFNLKKNDPKLFQHVMGVSSNILKTPLQPAMVEQSIDDPEKYSETKVICPLAIDVAKKTLIVAPPPAPAPKKKK